MPRIPNTPVVLSQDSYTILNGIRNTIGGEFREATPLVESAESLAAYGDVVMGSGHYLNQYIGLIGKIAEQILLHYSYENPLKLLKRGVLQFGESVEIDWVRLTMPEGYTQSVANPGDVFKTNDPEVLFTWHPVNSQLFYETTINENEIRLCFTSENGVQDLISVIIQRLYDSSEWDEQIVMQYLLARAYLDNKSKLAVEIPAVTKANADDIVIAQKKVSNDMRFMNTKYNIAGEAAHCPVDKQVFLISSELSAVVDVGSLAKAFNLEYNQFIGQSIMVDGFSFDTAKLARLDNIMQITAAQGLIPNYTPFTDEELASLEAVQGAIMDKNFLVIYDRLVELRDAIDARHLNVNYFLHLWKIYSYNVFAQCRFFTTEEVGPVGDRVTMEVYPIEISLAANQSYDCSGTVLPADATVTAVSSNSGVATVTNVQNSDGTISLTIEGVNAGSATITVTGAKEGYTSATATIAVTVTDPLIEITADPSDLSSGISAATTVTITTDPADAEVTVESTEETVATVAYESGTLTVTPVANGTTMVKVYANKEGYHASVLPIDVTVSGLA